MTFYVKQYRDRRLVWRHPMSHRPGLPSVHEAIKFGGDRGLDFTVVDENENVVYSSTETLVENSAVFIQD